jgi:hypothetical protein
VGPDGRGLERRLHGFSGDVEEADIVLIEVGEGVFNAVDIPGDRVEVLAEAGEELADGRVFRARRLREHHGLHHEVGDGDERSMPYRELLIAAVEAVDREDFVVPFVGGVQIVDDVG